MFAFGWEVSCGGDGGVAISHVRIIAINTKINLLKYNYFMNLIYWNIVIDFVKFYCGFLGIFIFFCAAKILIENFNFTNSIGYIIINYTYF